MRAHVGPGPLGPRPAAGSLPPCLQGRGVRPFLPPPASFGVAQGVRGRNSDNKLILEKLGWEPTIKLEVRGAGRSGCV